jgi:hypothetical protein
MNRQPHKSNLIFLSYRREDTPAITGRIYDRLVQRFGREAIFKDVDSIPLGVNFRQHIDSIIAECSVVLVVIGNRWAGGAGEAGKRRLDDPRDFVRIEVESALKRGVPVVPLLVDHATMPLEDELPESLTELAYRNGMSIDYDPHFHTDVDRLIKSLEAASTAHAGAGSAAPRATRDARVVARDIPPTRTATVAVNLPKRRRRVLRFFVALFLIAAFVYVVTYVLGIH